MMIIEIIISTNWLEQISNKELQSNLEKQGFVTKGKTDSHIRQSVAQIR